MISWDACTFEPNSILRWIECHPSFAGYLQAIGTIAAFALALLAPPIVSWVTDHRKRAAQLLRSQRVAAGLGGEVVTLGIECRNRLDRLRTAKCDTEEDRRSLLSVMPITLPGKIDLIDVESQGLDPIVLGPIIGAAAHVRSYNGKLQILSQEHYFKDDNWEVALGALKGNLESLNTYLDDATERLLKLFGTALHSSNK